MSPGADPTSSTDETGGSEHDFEFDPVHVAALEAIDDYEDAQDTEDPDAEEDGEEYIDEDDEDEDEEEYDPDFIDDDDSADGDEDVLLEFQGTSDTFHLGVRIVKKPKLTRGERRCRGRARRGACRRG